MKHTSTALTERELDIIEALSNGLFDKEIAGQKFIALETVKKHVRNIYKKIGVRNRVEAAVKYHFGNLQATA